MQKSYLNLVSKIGLIVAACLVMSACHKGGDDSTTKTVNVSGTVTYTRVPMNIGEDGIPTGLETDSAKWTTLPARGVGLQIWTTVEETDLDDNTVKVLKVLTTTTTDEDGAYSFSDLALPDYDTEAFVELYSIVDPSVIDSDFTTQVRLIADPEGIDSPLNQADRLLYSLRKGVGGTVSLVDPTPLDPLTQDATVNFNVGVNDRWWRASGNVVPADEATLEDTPTGSRVLGILDSVINFTEKIGDPTPGATLDLHYSPGLSHTRGSFVEYDRLQYPQSYNASGSRHYFGSVRGGTDNDDAWDEGVLFSLFSENVIYKRFKAASPTFSPIRKKDPFLSGSGAELVDLTPESALYHACPDIVTALALGTPYFGDAYTNGVRVRDIRETGGAPVDLYSAPNLRALMWDLILKANSITPPGTYAEWSEIDPLSFFRFFSLQFLSTDTEDDDDDEVLRDLINIYSQLPTLQNSQSTAEPIDLAAIFTDDVLTAMLARRGITWPRPTSGTMATFLANWGTDLPVATDETAFTVTPSFTMNEAQLDVLGEYPNQSRGEVYNAKFCHTKYSAYYLNVDPLPPHGAALRVSILNAGTIYSFYAQSQSLEVQLTFDENSSTDPEDFSKRFTLSGDDTETYSYYLYLVRLELESPTTFQTETYTPTITITPVN